MQLTMEHIEAIALTALKSRPNKRAKQVVAFVYWWRDRDIIFFDLKHFAGRIVHTVEFDTDDVTVTVCILK